MNQISTNDDEAVKTLLKDAVSSGAITEETLKRVKRLTELQRNLADYLIDRFHSNIEAFKKYLPNIANKFEHYKPSRSIEFFCLENGVPNLMYVDTNEVFYKTEDPSILCKNQVEDLIKTTPIKSTKYNVEYDPIGQLHHRYINEMTRLLDANNNEETILTKDVNCLANCVILGVGLGYHIGYLYEKIEIANSVIIEPEEDLFFASLHTFDWKNLLNYLADGHYGIYFVIGVTPEKFTSYLNSFYSKRGNFLSGFWWNYIHYTSDKMIELIKIHVDNNYRNYAALGFIDDHLFGTSHAVYAILHHAHFIKKDKRLPDKWKNAPIFVIGNGPSLDNDIHFLRKNQDKAIIIACGTAYDALYHAGIQPDFYGCTERNPQISQTIKMLPDQEYIDSTILLASDSVHPYTLDCFKHNAIFYKPDEPFFWLARFRIKGDFEKINYILMMNPLVGNFGTSAAIVLGFRNIYLFGLDNGKKIGAARMHSKFSELYGTNQSLEQGASYATGNTVPGNFGGECESGGFYKLSVNSMEHMFALFKGTISVYNCSDGVLIKGAEPKHSSDLDFDNLPNLDKESFHKFIEEEFTMQIKTSKEEIVSHINFKDYDDCIDYLKGLFDHRPNTRRGFIDIMQTSSEYLIKLNHSTRKFISSNIAGSLQSSFICILRALYSSKDENKCLELANKLVDLYIHYLDDSKIIYRYQPDYILGPHQKYLNGKVGSDFPDSKAPNLPNIDILVKKTIRTSRKNLRSYTNNKISVIQFFVTD